MCLNLVSENITTPFSLALIYFKLRSSPTKKLVFSLTDDDISPRRKARVQEKFLTESLNKDRHLPKKADKAQDGSDI